MKRDRCTVRSPGGMAPDGKLPRTGVRCGLDEGHAGDHTILMETGAPLCKRKNKIAAASRKRNRK